MRQRIVIGIAAGLLAIPAWAWGQSSATAGPDLEFDTDLGFDVETSAEADLLRPDTSFLDDVSLSMLQDDDSEEPGIMDADTGPAQDETGTDPRDFSSKFMPYYRYTELRSDVRSYELTLFGMVAFTGNFAMTYEFAVAKRVDYSAQIPGSIPPGTGFPPGVPSGGLDPDGDEVGIGDLNLRLFYQPKDWRWMIDDPAGTEKKKNISLMPVIETTLPTANEPVLGSESWILSPGITVVADIPGGPPFGLGFFAMMNFYDFTVWKDNSRNSVSRYRGRWFWMQPLTRPGENIFDGLYVLTEFQPVYDFLRDEFTFWIGPEFGKIVKPGFIVYAKPGWEMLGENPDRRFSFEFGMRIFY